jgi:phage terminase large subunit-like protein
MIAKGNFVVFITIYFYTFSITMAARISANSGHQEDQSQGMLHRFQASEENDGYRQIKRLLQKFASDDIGKYDKIHRTDILRSVRSAPPDNVYEGGILRAIRSPSHDYIQRYLAYQDGHASGGSRLSDINDRMMRSMRSVPTNDVHGEGILRTMRSGPPDNILADGKLRSMRSGPPEDLHTEGILRSTRSKPSEKICIV